MTRDLLPWRLANRFNEYLTKRGIDLVESQADPEDLLPNNHEYSHVSDYRSHILHKTDPHFSLLEFEGFDEKPYPRFASRLLAFMQATIFVAIVFTGFSSASPRYANWQLSAAELVSIFVNYPFYSIEWAIIILFVPAAVYALLVFNISFAQAMVSWSDKLVNVLWFFIVHTVNLYLKITHRILVRYAASYYYRRYSDVYSRSSV